MKELLSLLLKHIGSLLEKAGVEDLAIAAHSYGVVLALVRENGAEGEVMELDALLAPCLELVERHQEQDPELCQCLLQQALALAEQGEKTTWQRKLHTAQAKLKRHCARFVAGLGIDFGTSQSPKSPRPRDDISFRPGCPAAGERHNDVTLHYRGLLASVFNLPWLVECII